jgi:hypothetical protein
MSEGGRMAKMRITIIGEYEADPKHYDTADPLEMSAMDAEAFRHDPFAAVDAMELRVITVVPLSDGGWSLAPDEAS